MTSIDIKAGQVIEIRPGEDDAGDLYFGIFVDRQLFDTVGPFKTAAERDAAIEDLRDMLTGAERSISIPATRLQ